MPVEIEARPSSKPIIFSSLMVLKILEGQKNQTRRLVTENFIVAPDFPNAFTMFCRYGKKGDRLWVRETWCNGLSETHDCWGYRADMKYQCGKPIPDNELKRWKPSIFMPRTKSRLTLKITDAKIERLLDCSNEDAIAEGFESRNQFFEYTYKFYPKLSEPNPWVWAISFKQIVASKDCEKANS